MKREDKYKVDDALTASSPLLKDNDWNAINNNGCLPADENESGYDFDITAYDESWIIVSNEGFTSFGEISLNQPGLQQTNKPE